MRVCSLFSILVLSVSFSFLAACNDDSSGGSGTVEETEYISCNPAMGGDCPDGSSCARLEGDAHTLSVCVQDEHVPCVADFECDGGQCISVQGLQQTICTQSLAEDIGCPFYGFDELEYEVKVGNETFYLLTEYVSESCELSMRLKSDLSNMAWHYVLYVDEDDSLRGVVGNGAQVEVLHLSLGWIQVRETDPDGGADPIEYTFFLVP